jgi:hypothetical protein
MVVSRPLAVKHVAKWIFTSLSNHKICSVAVGDLNPDVSIQKISFVRCSYLCWVRENGVRPCVALSWHHKATGVPMATCHAMITVKDSLSIRSDKSIEK